MSRLAIFDFDGTYTRCDTLPLFLKFVFGKTRYWLGVFCCLPYILAFKLRLVSGGCAKEHLLKFFLKGMDVEEFERWGQRFAVEYKGRIERPEIVQAIERHRQHGDALMVVSASVKQWIEPWFEKSSVQVLSTEMEVGDDGRLTGYLATPNCNGSAKVDRILQAVPDAREREWVCYGDSRGDRPMMEMAAEAHYRPWEQGKGWAERHPVWLFAVAMLIMLLYQMLGVFWGMDVADAGFYLTFYDNIFTHPSSVEYNFMYYLSGVIGGAAQWLFPGMGIVGMRLLGVACCLMSSILVFLMLRQHVSESVVVLGLVMVIASFTAPQYTFCYDLCTILLYVCAIYALYRQSVSHKYTALWAVVAGVMVGFNIFVRIPNILGLVVCLFFFIREFDKPKRCWRAALTSALWLLVGVLIACGAVFGMMAIFDGHLAAFVQVLHDLLAIAGDHSGTASHTTSQMMLAQFKFYATELWVGIKLGTLVLIYCLAGRYVKHSLLLVGVKVLCLAVFVWMVARMHPLQPVWVMSLLGCIWVIARCNISECRWLAWLGLGMMLVMPYGSDGAYNNGSVIAWVAAPVAAMWWIRNGRVAFVLALVAVCAVRMVAVGAYFDAGPLYDKQETIDCDRAQMVYTTQHRADVINQLLKGIKPYVQPGTTLMAYGSIPTINYLTRTHPYIGCSWPEQLSASMLQEKLTEASHYEVPMILQQKFNTLGPEWGEPSNTFLYDYGDSHNVYQDNRKLLVLNDFLRKNNYHAIYEDSHFVLYAAQEPGVAGG